MYTKPMSPELIDPIEQRIHDSIELLRQDLLRSDIYPLKEQCDRIHRLVVDTKACLVTQAILSQASFLADFPKSSLNDLANELNSALLYLRRKLKEKEDPDQSYKDWYSVLRERLSSLFPDSVLVSFLPRNESFLEDII